VPGFNNKTMSKTPTGKSILFARFKAKGEKGWSEWVKFETRQELNKILDAMGKGTKYETKTQIVRDDLDIVL